MMEFGDTVKDKITEFKGIVVARTDYLNGCVQFEVQPPVDEEGKIPDSAWIDRQQLIKIKKSSKRMESNDEHYIFGLGDELRDTITGFQGFAMSIVHDMNNKIQYEIQPSIDKDGKVPDACFIDEKILELITPRKPEEPEPKGGGKRNHPPKSR